MASKVIIEFPCEQSKTRYGGKSVRRSISLADNRNLKSTLSISPANSDKNVKKPQLLLMSRQVELKKKDQDKPPRVNNRVSPSLTRDITPKRQLSSNRNMSLKRAASSNTTNRLQIID